MKPTYKIPTIRNDRSGLVFSRGVFKAMYTVDGKKRTKSMKTKDLKLATYLRDEFYKSLGVDVVHGDGDRFVYKVESYIVKIRGKYVGSTHTIEDARKMRDDALADSSCL